MGILLTYGYLEVKCGFLGQVRLVWQIWPSGQELGSQPQAPGSIPLAPLDPTSVLVGGAPSVFFCFFAKKSVLKMRNNVFPDL